MHGPYINFWATVQTLADMASGKPAEGNDDLLTTRGGRRVRQPQGAA